MPYLLLGFVALAAVLLVLRGFTNANPAALARQLRLAIGAAALGSGLVLLTRGAVGWALPLSMLGAALLLQSAPFRFPTPSSGNASRVETEHLEVELDHDTGAIRGSIRKGFFKGCALESLKPVELAHLWHDCRFDDPQSAQILEAYLDRVHPSWREDMARAEREQPRGPDGRMTREEAYEILGLTPGATNDEIRAAHRELMLKVHPDHGGSTYLAAKINEAKDVLLG
jgi:hypothetical protein